MENNNVKKRNRVTEACLNYLNVQAIPLSVLALMIIAASILSPAFFSLINLRNLLISQTTIMVTSMGMFIVILTGGIDLSVGPMMAMAGVLCADFMNRFPFIVAVFLAILCCMFLGTVSGTIIAKLRIAPFIVTLGMKSFASGIAYWYCNSSPISWRDSKHAELLTKIGTSRILNNIPVLAIIWFCMILITAFIVKRTVFGRIVYGIGGNEEAVTLSGINIRNWKIAPYIYSSFCCAIAGILLMSRLGLGSPKSGDGLETDCIAAVVIGGTSMSGGKGTISGVIIGVFILGIINNILDLMNVSSYPQLMLKGTIIVLAVILSTIREKNA